MRNAHAYSVSQYIGPYGQYQFYCSRPKWYIFIYRHGPIYAGVREQPQSCVLFILISMFWYRPLHSGRYTICHLLHLHVRGVTSTSVHLREQNEMQISGVQSQGHLKFRLGGASRKGIYAMRCLCTFVHLREQNEMQISGVQSQGHLKFRFGGALEKGFMQCDAYVHLYIFVSRTRCRYRVCKAKATWNFASVVRLEKGFTLLPIQFNFFSQHFHFVYDIYIVESPKKKHPQNDVKKNTPRLQ